MERCPDQPLNLVGYSHGGNVILNYLNQSYAHFADNVVTLGTPSRIDFWINTQVRSRFRNFCAVSLDNDGVQFGGAHPAQLVGYALATSWSRAYQGRAFEYLRLRNREAYFYYYELHIAAQSAAAAIMKYTRVQPGAQNFLYNGGLFPSRDAHTTVRDVGVWRRATSERNWSCR